jgi:hypothetical protein
LLRTCDGCAGLAELVRRVDERALRELTPAERRSLARGS